MSDLTQKLVISFVGILLPIVLAWYADRHPHAMARRTLENAKLRVDILQSLIRGYEACASPADLSNVKTFARGEFDAVLELLAPPRDLPKTGSIPLLCILFLFHWPPSRLDLLLRILFGLLAFFGGIIASIIIFQQKEETSTIVISCVMVLSPALSTYLVLVHRAMKVGNSSPTDQA